MEPSIRLPRAGTLRRLGRASRLAAVLAVVCGALGCAAGRALAEPVPPVNTAHNVAVNGYDPVAYFTAGEPTPGLDRYRFDWQGATYRFASVANRDLFAADPARYAPRYGGYCAYAMAVDQIADIDPHRWEITDGRLYLNANRLAQGLWTLTRAANIAAADKHWAALPKREPTPAASGTVGADAER